MFGNVHHIALVYKNIEEKIEKFKELFGIEIFNRTDLGVIKVARAMIGKLQIDFIEPLNENSIFHTFLKDGNEGFHHIGIQVKDFEEKVKEWESKGLKKLIESELFSVKFVYFDTREIAGHITELMQEY
ncbi:MAG: VOC family protein [Promethearchaeota archaeon]